MQGIPNNQRVYLLIVPGSDGQTELRLSMDAPVVGSAVAAILLRGKLPGGDIAVSLVSDPTANPALRGAPGANATDQQVAAAVATYLTNHPPAAGKDGTSPTIAIGKVATLAPGAAVTVANSGTAEAVVLDIGIPAGMAGSPGANASDAQVASAVAAWMTAHPISTVLGTVTFGETATIAIQAGVRQVTVALAGVKLGDAILLAPAAALPAGYLLGHAVPAADGQIQIALTVPLIAIGGKYSITARVLRVNS